MTDDEEQGVVDPEASANINAKFIAHTDTGISSVIKYNDPAVATRPRIVSISGSPAATSAPNASTRMISVTGHETSSEWSIAFRLALLKSDHKPLAPVRHTCTPPEPAACSGPLRSSATRTISLLLPPAPPITRTV